ncbi:MAG TPA: hypothetical protein VH796_01515 [Nitrososphaeraceae archaeon]|jgi:hypothetical protein
MPKELRLHNYPEDRKLDGFANVANQENSNKPFSKELVRAMDAAVKVTYDGFERRRACLIVVREQGMKEAIAPKQLGHMLLNMSELDELDELFESLGLPEVFDREIAMMEGIFFDENQTDRFIIHIQNENRQLKDKLATLETQLRIN